ncbi:MAG: hypothetical protein HQL31_00810 [Planctomycetes bacterium]|nr:hypothetical protein [Planctomycetota bacterium]
MSLHIPDSGQTQQALVLVRADGSSEHLIGDAGSKRGTAPVKDVLPSYLTMGWHIVNMVPFSGESAVLILLQRENKL